MKDIARTAFTHPDFPGERLVACRNPDLAERRVAKRASLLESTTRQLDQVSRMVSRGRLHGKDVIDAPVRRILKQYNIGKDYTVDVRDDRFDYEIDRDALAAEVAAIHQQDARAAEAKQASFEKHMESIARKLDKVQQKTKQGQLHGIQWHMIEAWRPLLFADEDQEGKASRDPVAPAQRSEGPLQKVHTVGVGVKFSLPRYLTDCGIG